MDKLSTSMLGILTEVEKAPGGGLLSRSLAWMRRRKPQAERSGTVNKYHQVRRTPIEELRGKWSWTRQLKRQALRQQEYKELGIGTGKRPLFDLPRNILRAIARTKATNRFRELQRQGHSGQ